MKAQNFVSRRFMMVDVFAERPLTGNPLPVVLDSEGLTTDDMLRITRWMNQSETTFLLPPSAPEADYRVRIFTLDRELPFAGHPTLGTCFAWRSLQDPDHLPDQTVQECEAGLICIRQDDTRLAFAAPPLLKSGPVDADKAAEVANVLRISSNEIKDMAWIDNGPGWIGVRLASADAVLALKPAASHHSRIEIGVVGTYPRGHEFAFEVRGFFTDQRHTVLEDPVTGSLNASLAQWLLDSGYAHAPYIARQGTKLDRDGRIAVATADGETWIGGDVICLVEGKITI